MEGPEFEAFAYALIDHLLQYDPWAGDLTVDDVRDMFTPDLLPPVKDDTS